MVTLVDEIGEIGLRSRGQANIVLDDNGNIILEVPVGGTVTINGIAVSTGASPATDTYLTTTDQTASLPNSSRQTAGFGIALDTSTPHVLAVKLNGAVLELLTIDDETTGLPNSRRLVAGSGIAFDLTAPGIFEILVGTLSAVTISSPGGATQALVVQGGPGQSGDILDVVDDSLSLLFSIDENGNISCPNFDALAITVAGHTTELTAILAATVLTTTDETAVFGNSRELLAGTSITFDDTTPGQRTVNGAAGLSPVTTHPSSALTNAYVTRLTVPGIANGRALSFRATLFVQGVDTSQLSVRVTTSNPGSDAVVATAIGAFDIDAAPTSAVLSGPPTNPITLVGTPGALRGTITIEGLVAGGATGNLLIQLLEAVTVGSSFIIAADCILINDV